MPEVLIEVEEGLYPPTQALIAGIEGAMRQKAAHLTPHVREQKLDPIYGQVTKQRYILNDERMRLAMQLAGKASAKHPSMRVCAYVMPTTFAIMERATRKIIASCNSVVIATATNGEPTGFTIELVGSSSIPTPAIMVLRNQVAALSQEFVRRVPSKTIVIDTALVAQAISAGIEFGVTGKTLALTH